MSYALPRRSGLGDAGIKIGEAAKHDPVLAKASLYASEIIRKVASLPKSERQAMAAHYLNRLSPGLGAEWKKELGRLLAKGVDRDQAIFDSMRLVIANRYVERGLEVIKLAVASDYGWDSLAGVQGLGDDTARDVGCAIAGGAGIIGGIIGSIYGGQAGGQAAATGTGTMSTAFDCNKRDRESAERVAATQAEVARLNLQAAQEAARAQERRGDQTIKMILIGGGIAGLVTIAVVALK